MAFVIENASGSISNEDQGVGNSVDIDTIVTGQSGLNVVLEGCAVTAQTTPNEQKVAISSGSVLTNGVLKAYAGVSGASGVSVGTTPDTTYSHIDLIVIDSTGAIQKRTGTAAAIPLMPSPSANDVVLAAVHVPNELDGLPVPIVTDDICDKRVFRQNGPITVYKTIAAETTNNTAAAINLLDKTNSGVVIPKGMMEVGRVLRCRMGGNWLHNTTASTTLKFDIILGGTTLYSATSGTATRTINVRGAWFVTFDIMYQASTVAMTINGKAYWTRLALKTAPTTGIGNGWVTGDCVWAFSGGSATPTNGADRTLQVQLTFSGVASASKEIVTEYATLELI